MKTTLRALIFLTTGLAWCATNAQTVVNASGGEAIGSGGLVAYSIGQVVYTTHEGSGSLAEGVQHAFEFFSADILETEFNISVEVLPNPSSDCAVLDICDFRDKAYSYRIFDMHGKLINQAEMETPRTALNIKNLSVGTYIILVQNQDNKKVKSLKFIKI